jgi:HEAT repeat protein
MKGLSKSSRRSPPQKSGDTITYTVAPVSDPKVFADRIDFGQVTRIDGRTIDVVARALRPGEVRPSDSDAIGAALYDLKSPLARNRKQALGKLMRMPVDQARRAEVALAISSCLTDTDGGTRGDAVKALAVWGGPETIPALIGGLKDQDFGVRWAILDTLKALKDPQAAEALAEMIVEKKDTGKASDALKSIGSKAETAVIPLLSHGDDRVRSDACKILQVIGTEKSVPMLMRLTMLKSGFSDGAARDALNAMRLRGVNLNVSKKKKR